jgi:hypothetical protein
VGRRWTWLAWSMLAVFIVIMVFWIILGVANGRVSSRRPRVVVNHQVLVSEPKTAKGRRSIALTSHCGSPP